MDKELSEYPRGTVAGVCMTSDVGVDLSNFLTAMIEYQHKQVQLVSADTTVRERS